MSRETASRHVALACTVWLALQYFVVVSALAFVRTWEHLKGTRERSTLHKVLKASAHAAKYAPIACMLFLACRIRADQLSQGTAGPPQRVQTMMVIGSLCIFGQTLLVMFIPLVTGEAVDTDSGGNVKNVLKVKSVYSYSFLALKYVFVFGLFTSAFAVIHGILTMQPPPRIWEGDPPPVSTTARCVIILSAAFFVANLIRQLAVEYNLLYKLPTSKLESVTRLGADCAELAPMLAVLFLSARMRSLQIDPTHGAPPEWAQSSMWICVWSLVANCLLVLLTPYITKTQLSLPQDGQPPIIKIQNVWLGKLLNGVKGCVLMCMYVTMAAVMGSLYAMPGPRGGPAPPLSPTVQAVVSLTVQYCLLHCVVWLFSLCQEYGFFSTRTPYTTLLLRTLEASKATVAFAPMLAILFVATRVKALQITNNKGGPPASAQTGMLVSSFAILVQLVMILATALTGRFPRTDEDGNLMPHKDDTKPLQIFVVLVRYTALLGLYGGASVASYWALNMTPADCTPIPLS